MKYIILDLEWDSVYFKPQKRFINHILQIGAVKLDENFNTIDTFSQIVRSDITKRVTSRFAKLTGITSEDMRGGVPFGEAVEMYNRFAKDAEVTMTWSNSDLHTIVENEEILLNNKLKFKISKYLDLQKLVQSHLYTKGYENKNQIALESAAELLEIETESYDLHTALDDCKVCALMLKKCYDEVKFNQLLRDAKAPDFFKRLKFKAYPISDINDSQIKKSELEFKCPECNAKAKRLKPWKYRNRWFVADFKCDSCGHKFNGRVTFKKTFDDLIVKHKVCEYRPKKRKENEMQPMPEKVPSTKN
ncbi:MAG: hypothetical protein E7560_05680 [Ruminococcaceae bacterium]|nr:hypothetical protein [Oscillospiraceae bacterium]